VTADVRKRS